MTKPRVPGWSRSAFPIQESPYFGGLTPFGVRRLAKVIKVDAEDGSFVALKQFVA